MGGIDISGSGDTSEIGVNLLEVAIGYLLTLCCNEAVFGNSQVPWWMP